MFCSTPGAEAAAAAAAPLEVVSVRSFPVPRVTGARAELLQVIKRKMRAEEQSLLNIEKATAGGASQSMASQVEVPGTPGQASVAGSLLASSNNVETASAAPSGHSSAHGLEAARRERRRQRTEELGKMVETKPGADDDDPADVAAIANAVETMGDFKVGYRG